MYKQGFQDDLTWALPSMYWGPSLVRTDGKGLGCHLDQGKTWERNL